MQPVDLPLHRLAGILLQQRRDFAEKSAQVLRRRLVRLQHLRQVAEARVEDLYKISTHTLGVAANAHARYEMLEQKINKLAKRVERLEAK